MKREMGVRDREAEQKVALQIARSLRKILAERNLTQADLARMARVHEPTLNRHLVIDQSEGGKSFLRCPTIALLIRYCDALHVSIDDIVGRGQSRQWADPDIQMFFETSYSKLTPEMRSWVRNTIDMLRRCARDLPDR